MARRTSITSGESRRRKIAERAYAIWENEGKPHGRDIGHWLEAEAEIAAQSGATKNPSPRKPASARHSRPSERPIR